MELTARHVKPAYFYGFLKYWIKTTFEHQYFTIVTGFSFQMTA